jgi:hypothetical protein
MIAIQVEVRQVYAQYSEINKVLGADDELRPGLLGCGHVLSSGSINGQRAALEKGKKYILLKA